MFIVFLVWKVFLCIFLLLLVLTWQLEFWIRKHPLGWKHETVKTYFLYCTAVLHSLGIQSTWAWTLASCGTGPKSASGCRLQMSATACRWWLFPSYSPHFSRQLFQFASPSTSKLFWALVRRRRGTRSSCSSFCSSWLPTKSRGKSRHLWTVPARPWR